MAARAAASTAAVDTTVADFRGTADTTAADPQVCTVAVRTEECPAILYRRAILAEPGANPRSAEAAVTARGVMARYRAEA